MKKLFYLIVSLVFFSNCSTYIKSTKKAVKYELTSNRLGFLNGYYDYGFWKEINDSKTTDTLTNKNNFSVEIKALSYKIIQAKLYENELVIDSIYLKGYFENSSYILKRKADISLLFPIFWGYEISDIVLYLDIDKNLCMKNDGKNLVFLTIAPIMAANGNDTRKFIRIK